MLVLRKLRSDGALLAVLRIDMSVSYSYEDQKTAKALKYKIKVKYICCIPQF